METINIHEFGLRYMYNELLKEGYEVLSIEPDPEVFPQMIARKDDQLYFIVVQSAAYPEVGDLPTAYQIRQIREHAQKHNAEVKFASLGIANAKAKTEAEKKVLQKGGEFYINYSGLKELLRTTS